MAHISKRLQELRSQLKENVLYPLQEAFDFLVSSSKVKFVERVEVAVILGVDPRKSDQVVRGAIVLPHGTGKTVRVAVLTQGQLAQDAENAGADIVGFEDLAEKIQKGEMNFDVLIASPDAMPIVGRLGPVLGPRGLMPNPKVGTVTKDIAAAVKNAKSGQVRFRTDKAGIIHCAIGTVKFTSQHLVENLQVLLAELKKLKPAGSKGVYIKKLNVSTTMGPGITVDLTTLETQAQ